LAGSDLQASSHPSLVLAVPETVHALDLPGRSLDIDPAAVHRADDRVGAQRDQVPPVFVLRNQGSAVEVSPSPRVDGVEERDDTTRTRRRERVKLVAPAVIEVDDASDPAS
jgi:hypothetical protein